MTMGNDVYHIIGFAMVTKIATIKPMKEQFVRLYHHQISIVRMDISSVENGHCVYHKNGVVIIVLIVVMMIIVMMMID